MITPVVQVALGGAVGAALRYLVGVWIVRHVGHGGFPVAILSVNVIGSFVMGVLVVALAQRGVMQFSPLLLTGLLGGFTTFSAFSLEAVTLYERGDLGQMAIYVGLSVVLSIAALMAGLWLARGIFA